MFEGRVVGAGGWALFSGALAVALVLAACNGSGASDECSHDPVTLESGLRYRDTSCGEGEEAARGDLVAVHYVGKLKDGQEFDSSRDGEPLEVAVGAGQVIEGFEEGLVGLRVGGKRELTIPPELGYGKAGSAGVIPPNATLVFEVELVRVEER